jgi:hypothetical protein
LHKFDSSWGDWSSALRSIIHDSHSSRWIGILDWNGWIDWIIVGSNFLFGVKDPGGSVILNSLLHLKTIWISIECLLLIKVANMELWNDLVTIEKSMKR